MPASWRHLVRGEDAYLERRDHERPAATAAPPPAEGVKSLCAVDIGAPTSGARFDLVGDLVGGLLEILVGLGRCAHVATLAVFRAIVCR